MDAVNWDAVGSLSEFLGAVGVFASLFYLALQMKRSANETRDASIHSVMELAIQFRAESYKGELAQIRMKVAMEEPLTALELLKFDGYLSALFELTELVFVQHLKGKLDPEYFEAWQLRTQAALAIPHVQQFWAKTRTGYRRSFMEHVDRLVES